VITGSDIFEIFQLLIWIQKSVSESKMVSKSMKNFMTFLFFCLTISAFTFLNYCVNMNFNIVDNLIHKNQPFSNASPLSLSGYIFQVVLNILARYPIYFHIFTQLHTLNSILFFLSLKSFLSSVRSYDNYVNHNCSLIVSFLFAVHPKNDMKSIITTLSSMVSLFLSFTGSFDILISNNSALFCHWQ
jgi:hypothetical protein